MLKILYLTFGGIMHHHSIMVHFKDMGQQPQVVSQTHLEAGVWTDYSYVNMVPLNACT